MRRIENIFQQLEGYNCFACGPNHPFGLKLQFNYDDDENEISTIITPDRLFAGFPGILHGGLQATILDEIAFWGAWAKYGRSGFTYDLKIRYKRKCPVGEELLARGHVGELSHRLVPVLVVLTGALSKEIFTEGEVKYYLPDTDPRKTEYSKIPDNLRPSSKMPASLVD